MSIDDVWRRHGYPITVMRMIDLEEARQVSQTLDLARDIILPDSAYEAGGRLGMYDEPHGGRSPCSAVDERAVAWGACGALVLASNHVAAPGYSLRDHRQNFRVRWLAGRALAYQLGWRKNMDATLQPSGHILDEPDLETEVGNWYWGHRDWIIEIEKTPDARHRIHTTIIWAFIGALADLHGRIHEAGG